MISTGEALPESSARRLLAGCKKLYDFYGPTETTIWSTVREVSERDLSGTIGRPIANTQVYVLDENRNLLPVGVPGEQVKLRGYRIELGEIQTVIDEHPAVAQSVVVLREDNQNGDKQLVAYWLPTGLQELKPSELRSHLQSHLPEYMIPVAFVQLASFPLTASGKIDRRSLPAPTQSRAGLETGYIAPRTLIEQQLASIWGDVLGLEEIGIHDNFFELGGHSLLATRINSRIEMVLKVDLLLRKIFEKLTIAELAEEISQLQRTSKYSGQSRLRPIDRHQRDVFPLSFAQNRIWFLEQLEGELTAYNMPFSWRIAGNLNSEALQRSIEAIIGRHESLRTTFSMEKEDPIQVIKPRAHFELPAEDLRVVENKLRESEILRRRKLETEKPLDLSTDLMIRGSLLRLSEDEHVLLLTLYHIAFDGWSLRAFKRELENHYAAFCQGTEAILPPLPVQYADYALWQRKARDTSHTEDLLTYWTNQLADLSPLELPTDFPRPANMSYEGKGQEFAVDPKLVTKLKKLSVGEHSTLHVTLLAAFQLLLARYSDQQDIAVGMPIAGRNHADLENLIGFFVNTLVLRSNLSGNPSFRELIGTVMETSLEAYDHQSLPFEKLVEELQPERDLGRSPLFQVLFQLVNFSDQDLALENLKVSRLPSLSERVRFDLEVNLWQEANQLRGMVIYRTDLFKDATIQRLISHYLTLLENLVATPDQRIGEVSLLTASEHNKLLVEWNTTRTDNPELCVHQLFEEQAERTPDTPAVIFEGRELTYRNLNDRANQLAHYLQQSPLRPDSTVAVFLEQSMDVAVAVLGVLKAGSAYVPLAETLPTDRLRLILDDAQPAVIITTQSLLGKLPQHRAKIVCLDSDWKQIESYSRENPVSRTGLANLVYVLYTSGSTGQPKGVAFLHRGGTNLICWQLKKSHPKPGHRALLFSPLSFDASFTDMFMTWASGGSLIMVPDEVRSDPQQLRDLIRHEKVERMNLPFVALNALAGFIAQAGEPSAFPALKEVISTAEQLLITPAIRALFTQNPQMRLQNQYGPTETHVITALTLEGPPNEWPSIPSIGTPIANTRIYILNDYMVPTPTGITGSLYIEGHGPARGYLNRPDLTEKSFVANPFSDDPQSRLYATGDLCRWHADGTLEFLGRQDHQVKLRGYRIELGEIEAVLNEHPGISQSTVILREDDARDAKRLVAYFISARHDHLNISELKMFLGKRLPDYMVPAAFVVLEKFPLTSSGKVNRRALPQPDDTRPELETDFAAPSNESEQKLGAIWTEVLGLENSGVHDNFFDLGGHSLLAIQVVARIPAAFEVKIKLRTIFDSPTIEQLAEKIEAIQRDQE